MTKKWALDDREQLHKDANKALDDNLMPGEQVKVTIRGVFDSAFIGTDRRVFVFKKGLFSGAFMGEKVATYDYRNLTGVQHEQGILNGFVSLQGPGIEARDMSYWSTGKNDPMTVAHAIATNAPHKEQAREGTAVLRRLIAENQGSAGVTTQAAPDPMDQIRKLAELRDAGILTASEFETKKQELLARL